LTGRIVSIDLNNYDSDGTEKDPLCGIGRNGTKVVKKFDTITDALFHELCHALHRYSGREMTKCKLLEAIYGESSAMRLWIDTGNQDDEEVYDPDDEEMYNMTGFYYDEETGEKKIDPISCNMFDICANASDPESIIQRVFHCGYNYYLKRSQTLKSAALKKIKEFLIDIDEYIERRP
jgi:hypothetical protein